MRGGTPETFNKEKFFTTKRLNHYTNQLEYNSIGNILHKGQLTEATYEDTGKKEVIAGKTYDYVYEYGAKPHAVLKAGTRTMSYDESGNMLTMTDTQASLTRAIVWDSENRIKNTTDNGVKTEYKYDAKGDRIIKKGSLGEVVYVNNNYTIRNNELESKHIFAGNTRVASKMKSAATDYGTYYFHADHLGSSNVITNKTGNFHEHIEYMPYGETWVEVKTSTDVDFPYRFTGKELDAESGLYYFGARYYDPKLSRWTAADPPIARGDYLPKPGDFDTDHNYFYYSAHDSTAKLKGMGGVFNPINLDAYHYAGQNPVKFIDPDGNSTWVDKKNNVTSVKNDGNLGIYRDGDSKMKNKLGETMFWNSFVDSKGDSKGHINFGNNKAENLVHQKANEAKGMSFWAIARESKKGGDLDIKKGQAHEGYLFQGKYVSLRDAGNILYGINMYNQGLGIERTMKAAGGYAVTGSRFGALQGMLGREYGPAPYYGEEAITGSRIEKGYQIAPTFK